MIVSVYTLSVCTFMHSCVQIPCVYVKSYENGYVTVLFVRCNRRVNCIFLWSCCCHECPKKGYTTKKILFCDVLSGNCCLGLFFFLMNVTL